MKKLLLALFTLTLSLSSLFANESAVKETIIRDIKFAIHGNFADPLKYYTQDIVDIDLDVNRKLYYKDILLMSKALDGKHPEEFLFMLYKAQSMKDPDPNQEKAIREYAKSEQFLLTYPRLCDMMKSIIKQASEIELRTIKFVKVEIKGDLATVIVEYESLEVAKKELNVTSRKTSTHKLRKVNGVWKFYERSSKKILGKTENTNAVLPM